MASRSPALALQEAVFAALTASPDVAAAFAPATPRIYDYSSVPAGAGGIITATFPYYTIGDDEITSHTPQIADECRVLVEIWSRARDNGELKTHAGAVALALSTTLAIAGMQTSTWRGGGERYLREPDGVTLRARLTFIYLTANIIPALPAF